MSEVGGPKLGLMNIGEEAKPPFAILADALSVLRNRSQRLAAHLGRYPDDPAWFEGPSPCTPAASRSRQNAGTSPNPHAVRLPLS